MTGKVTLLGAGPGDPDLLTLIGKRRLQEADVVLYDRLIDPSLLAFTKQNASLVNVGKMPEHHRVSQAKINQLLVDYAEQGKRVVRLKAGDPYVFGRGGEEAQFLRKHGVDFEVIPGITSAIAGLAAVGIPITHRDFASSFHVLTGHRKKNGHELDWANIAKQEGTLVFLMGMAQLKFICQKLIAFGKNPRTPVAVIQWATQWRQRMVTGKLSDIQEKVLKKKIGAPALIVIGDVVRLSRELNLARSLQGVHLLLPYSKHSRLRSGLTDLGATVDFYPRAFKKALNMNLSWLKTATGIVFDDFASFKLFTKALIANHEDWRDLKTKKIFASNKAAAKRMGLYGIQPDAIFDRQKEIPAGCVEIGGSSPLRKNSYFVSTYQLVFRSLSLPFNLSEFSGAIFPSTASLRDFLHLLSPNQKQELKDLRAFTMGKSIKKAALQAGFAEVINCEGSTESVLKHVQKVFARSK